MKIGLNKQPEANKVHPPASPTLTPQASAWIKQTTSLFNF